MPLIFSLRVTVYLNSVKIILLPILLVSFSDTLMYYFIFFTLFFSKLGSQSLCCWIWNYDDCNEMYQSGFSFDLVLRIRALLCRMFPSPQKVSKICLMLQC